MISIRTRTRQAAVLSSMVAILFAAAPSFAQTRAQRREMRMRGTAADEAAIRQVVERYRDAFNHHDAQAVAALYAPNADFTNMYGDGQHGRPAIERDYTNLFSGRLKEAHYNDTVKSIRMLGPRLAVMDANWEMSGTTGPNGAPPNPVRKGMLTWVMAQRDGEWYILVFHEFDFPGQ
jgi:uncharacterized protein (TIGR02246 family)